VIGEAARGITVARGVLEAVIDHARREAPIECCGFLIGTPSRVDRIAPMTNIAFSQVRFLVDPREHIALAKHLRGTGLEIVGAYHSHPRTAAEPSPTDVAEAYYSELVYVIVSLADPAAAEVRAYRIQGSRVTPIALVSERSIS